MICACFLLALRYYSLFIDSRGVLFTKTSLDLSLFSPVCTTNCGHPNWRKKICSSKLVQVEYSCELAKTCRFYKVQRNANTSMMLCCLHLFSISLFAFLYIYCKNEKCTSYQRYLYGGLFFSTPSGNLHHPMPLLDEILVIHITKHHSKRTPVTVKLSLLCIFSRFLYI